VNKFENWRLSGTSPSLSSNRLCDGERAHGHIE
jgi:hypothetical protein